MVYLVAISIILIWNAEKKSFRANTTVIEREYDSWENCLIRKYELEQSSTIQSPNAETFICVKLTARNNGYHFGWSLDNPSYEYGE